MRKRKDRTKGEPFVSAKELAEMGFCEKRVLLAHVNGQRFTAEQRRSAERGLRAHEVYYREGLAAVSADGSDRRCFVATRLYGDEAWQTRALRRFRDEVLLQRRLGREFVAAYYAIAPAVCRVLTRLPWLRPPVRALVAMLARVARHSIGARAS